MTLIDDRYKVCSFIKHYKYGYLCDDSDLCEECSILVAGVPIREIHEWHKERMRIIKKYHWCDNLSRGEPMLLLAKDGRGGEIVCQYCKARFDLDNYIEAVVKAKYEFIKKRAKNVPTLAQL
jgi:hypothetical protein